MLLESWLALRVTFGAYVLAVVWGLVVDAHLSPRCLVGLHRGTVPRVLA